MGLMRPSTSFLYNGRHYTPADIVRDDDPLVRDKPSLFVPIDGPTIERATAAPGEKRATKRAAKKATKKRA